MSEHIFIIASRFEEINREAAKRIVGQERLIRNIIIALFAGGHILLE